LTGRKGLIAASTDSAEFGGAVLHPRRDMDIVTRTDPAVSLEADDFLPRACPDRDPMFDNAAILRTTLIALAAAMSLAAQDAGEPAAERFVNSTGEYALARLPDGWRQATPDEARTLSKRNDPNLPLDLMSPRPAPYYPLGPVDRWLEQGYDGMCLAVVRLPGEPRIDEEELARLQTSLAADLEHGWTRRCLDGEIVKIGGNHPALRITTVLQPPTAGATATETIDLFVPSGGNTLNFSFRAFEPAFEAARPMFETMIAGLGIARPAKGEQSLGDHLFYPIVIGGLVGLLLLFLRKQTAA